MRSSITTATLLLLGVALALPVNSAGPADLIQIMRGELERNFQILGREAESPVYYLAYAITDSESQTLSATHGAIRRQNQNRSRRLDVTVRTGSPELDNYHVTDGRMARFTSGAEIPIENVPNAIRQSLWRETDRTYRRAARRLIEIRTEQKVNVEKEDAPPDFSPAEPAEASEVPGEIAFSAEDWVPRLRKLSSVFGEYPDVIASEVGLSVIRNLQHFVNTEGTAVSHGWSLARISIQARAKAPDGMDLLVSDSFEATTPEGLPDDERIRETILEIAADVSAMRDAPLVEPYVAPAILSGRAAGVFFHEIFGHRVEGHRLKSVDDGQTFGNSIGATVLPEFLSVVFDPTRHAIGGADLIGWYEFDDEGVAARPVTVVENGIMKTFLMSRTPVQGISGSNGHGRRQPGREVVSRQSNLIVESSRAVSEAELRELLIDEIREQGKEYGFYFEQVTGGFTNTGRSGIQAFKVIPLVVYRVYPDGRPDELVRGADMVGTPLAAFSKIIATGEEAGVFNGYCGAESGNVPVSAVSPPLLVSEIEIQRKESSQDRPPLLPRPPASSE